MRRLSLLLLAGCGAEPAEPVVTTDAAVEVWATYTIEIGRHDADLTGGGEGTPLRGFVEVAGRDYRFTFDASAAYVLTMPTQPEDQLDWNKLPGLSDCETIDLAVDGAMFGWRWRVDLAPPVLEVTAYANAGGVHMWAPEPMVVLAADALATELHYRVWPDGEVYRFTVGDVTAALPRACPATPAVSFKWAAGLYFGGTSVAPSRITGRIAEIPFAR